MIGRLLTRLSTRRCRGCDDPSFHTAHLTRLGQWRYIDRHSERVTPRER